MGDAIDLVILCNGPGELLTWVKPVARALRRRLGEDRALVRISVVLSPDSNASGGEADLARRYAEVDRVQGAESFFPFLLLGKTAEAWDWRSRGVVIFLGGDQVFPLVIGKRLGYKTVLYTEWDALWPRFADRYGVTREAIAAKAPAKFGHKFAVVGDLMVEAGAQAQAANLTVERIGILPGSKAAKLTQGLPFFIEIADRLSQARAGLEFVIPVAPTLSLEALAAYGDGEKNPVVALVGGRTCRLVRSPEGNYLETAGAIGCCWWSRRRGSPTRCCGNAAFASRRWGRIRRSWGPWRCRWWCWCRPSSWMRCGLGMGCRGFWRICRGWGR